MKANKLQDALISHLLKEGQLELLLPDGMLLEIGITQEDKHGNMVKTDNYCWLNATQRDRNISLDAYNLALQFLDDDSKILLEASDIDKDGRKVMSLSLV